MQSNELKSKLIYSFKYLQLRSFIQIYFKRSAAFILHVRNIYYQKTNKKNNSFITCWLKIIKTTVKIRDLSGNRTCRKKMCLKTQIQFSWILQT